MSEDEEITFNFKVDRGNYDEGMKALEILDNLEKEAKNEEKEAEIDFDAMEEDISKIASTDTASIGKYILHFLIPNTPEPWYSKQARQTPFVYYIKSFTISSQSKNEIIKYYYA